jgi:hypothetical protein
MTIQAFSSRLPRFALAALVAAFVGGAAWAQEPKPEQDEESGPSPVELARQIRRNMLKIEEDLSKAGTHDPERGERVKKDLDELLDSMKQRQDQVIKDIDEIVKQIKVSKCNSGGQGESDSNENQKNSRARDRNQAQDQGKPRDPNKGGKPKPKDGQKPGKKKGSGAEDNSKKEEPQGDNDPGDPKAQPKGEKVSHININEIWGNLPLELRQKLVDRNYDDFTPEYKEQIEEYFRKTGTAPKK